MSERSDGCATVQGQLLQLDEHHAVATYMRDGTSWVAEFRGDAGALTDAATWYRFHAGELRYSHRRRAAALRSATALTPEIIEKIGQLHRRADVKDTRIAAGAVAALVTMRRHWIEMTAPLRGVPSTRSAGRAGALTTERTCWVGRLARQDERRASNMKNYVRNVGTFAICLAAVFSWIGVMAFQLSPYVGQDSGSTVTIPADNTTD